MVNNIVCSLVPTKHNRRFCQCTEGANHESFDTQMSDIIMFKFFNKLYETKVHQTSYKLLFYKNCFKTEYSYNLVFIRYVSSS